MILYKARVEEQSLTLAFFYWQKQIHLLIGRGDGHKQNCVKQKVLVVIIGLESQIASKPSAWDEA